MPFIFLIFFAALSMEVIGSYISVMGLSSIFNGSIVIMTMAIVLDIAKITCVSFIYTYWSTVNKTLRTYMFLATVVLMMITSAGAFGYLSAEFMNAVIPNKESSIKLQTLSEEQSRLQLRKVEIDKQISQILANIVRNRIKLIDSFKDETKRVNDRLSVIDEELPKLKIANVTVAAHTGPIAYVATAFNISMEEAVKYVILLIIGVFDPLAISLILAGNFLIAEQKKIFIKLENLEITEPIHLTHPLLVDPPAEEIISSENDSFETEIPELELVPIEKIQEEIVLVEEDEPINKVRTEKQLDKLFTKYTEKDVALPELIVKEEFTPAVEDDKISYKGILSAANTNHSGADVYFEQTPSNSVSHYS